MVVFNIHFVYESRSTAAVDGERTERSVKPSEEDGRCSPNTPEVDSLRERLSGNRIRSPGLFNTMTTELTPLTVGSEEESADEQHSPSSSRPRESKTYPFFKAALHNPIKPKHEAVLDSTVEKSFLLSQSGEINRGSMEVAKHSPQGIIDTGELSENWYKCEIL